MNSDCLIELIKNKERKLKVLKPEKTEFVFEIIDEGFKIVKLKNM